MIKGCDNCRRGVKSQRALKSKKQVIIKMNAAAVQPAAGWKCLNGVEEA